MNSKNSLTADDTKYIHHTMDRTRDINKTDLVTMVGAATQCTKCPLVAASSAALVLHFKEKHKYLCFHCPEPKNWESNLTKSTWRNDHCRKNHRDGTLEPEPIVCSFCDNCPDGFKNENSYYKHLESHHDYYYAMERARYGGVNPLCMRFAQRLLQMPNVTEIPREVFEKHAALNPQIDPTPVQYLYLKIQQSLGPDMYVPFEAKKGRPSKTGIPKTLYKKTDIPPGAIVVERIVPERKKRAKRKKSSSTSSHKKGQQQLQIRSSTSKSCASSSTNRSAESDDDVTTDSDDDDDESFVPEASEEENAGVADAANAKEKDALDHANKRPKLDVESFAFVKPSTSVTTRDAIAGESTTSSNAAPKPQPIVEEWSLYVGAIPSPIRASASASTVQATSNEDSITEMLVKEHAVLIGEIKKQKVARESLNEMCRNIDTQVDNNQKEVETQKKQLEAFQKEQENLQKKIENLQKKIENGQTVAANLRTKQQDMHRQKQEKQNSIETVAKKFKEISQKINERVLSI